jgi:hypothetical protein
MYIIFNIYVAARVTMLASLISTNTGSALVRGSHCVFFSWSRTRDSQEIVKEQALQDAEYYYQCFIVINTATGASL